LFLILAFLIALGVVVVAVVEIDSRRDDDQVAIPTTLPSPTDVLATAAPTVGPTDQATDEATPQDTAEGTTDAAPTQAPTPSEAEETDAPAATATPTVAPPRTPTPEPLGTAGPIVEAQGRTPRTGGDALPFGSGLALIALALRAVLARRRTSY
jgi:hypothetical protein